MKERPIRFNGPMVRALLDGKKTQTRRIIKPQPDVTEELLRKLDAWIDGFTLSQQVNAAWQHGFVDVDCPYGEQSDRLWVREKFQPLYAEGYEFRSVDWDTGKGYAISYPATDGIHEYLDPDDNITSACKPSIHMPRWASRILLEIVSIRVEKLQDISEADAVAEGGPVDHPNGTACGWYEQLWEQINGPDSWDVNPWVWVVEFRRIEP